MGTGMRANTVAAMKAMRIACAVVLLSLGFGHQPVQGLAVAQVRDAVAAQAADYRLPDGSFAGLCIGAEDGPLARHSRGLPRCDVCLMSAGVLLPLPDTTSWLKTRFAWLSNAPRGSAAVTAWAANGIPRSRGPPVTL